MQAILSHFDLALVILLQVLDVEAQSLIALTCGMLKTWLNRHGSRAGGFARAFGLGADPLIELCDVSANRISRRAKRNVAVLYVPTEDGLFPSQCHHQECNSLNHFRQTSSRASWKAGHVERESRGFGLEIPCGFTVHGLRPLVNEQKEPDKDLVLKLAVIPLLKIPAFLFRVFLGKHMFFHGTYLLFW